MAANVYNKLTFYIDTKKTGAYGLRIGNYSVNKYEA